jgi:hypothetical protein
MSSPTTYDAFEVRLRTAWTATALVFENEHDQPLLDAGMPFVYVEIYGDNYNQETFGAPQNNQFLEEGVSSFHVMMPSGQGSRQARIWANDILNLFREQPIGSLFMPEMSIGAGAPGKDFPNYFAITATINWYRRDYTSIPTP